MGKGEMGRNSWVSRVIKRVLGHRNLGGLRFSKGVSRPACPSIVSNAATGVTVSIYASSYPN